MRGRTRDGRNGGIVAAACVALVACGPADDGGALETTASRAHALAVRPGEAFALGRVGLIAPAPGLGVVAEVLPEEGDAEIVHLVTDEAGTVFLVPHAEPVDDDDVTATGEAMTESTSLNGSPAPCNDKASALLGYRWKKAFAWSFASGSTPAGMSVADAEARLKAAAQNVTTSRNSCGLADQVSATHSYLGRKGTAPAIAADGSCGAYDGANAVGFGDLPKGVLGVTCSWHVGDEVVESDVRFNKVDHKFYATKPSTCVGRYSLEGVATHEFGHVFGLGHVTEAKHGNLTMSTAVNGPCEGSEATLGRGDVIGLRALY